MPIGHANSSVIRLVNGQRGKMAMRLHLTLRFDYGATVPWVTQLEGSPHQLQIMYGLSGERQLLEWEVTARGRRRPISGAAG